MSQAPCCMMESPKAATTQGAAASVGCSTRISDRVVVALVISQGSTVRERLLRMRALGSSGSAHQSPLTERVAKMLTKLPETTLSGRG